MDSKNETNIDQSELSAGRDIELIGGNKYEVNVTPPSSDANLEQLEKSLTQNRAAFLSDEKYLIKLLSQGELLESPEVEATIKNLISSIRSIELLIPAIKLRGGNAAYTSKDSGSPAKRINDIIEEGTNIYEYEQEKLRREEAREVAKNKFIIFIVFIIIIIILFAMMGQ